MAKKINNKKANIEVKTATIEMPVTFTAKAAREVKSREEKAQADKRNAYIDLVTTAPVEENTATEQAASEDNREVWELIPTVDELNDIAENETAPTEDAAKVNIKKTAKMQKARAKAHKAKARAKAKAEKAAQQAALAAITLPYKGGRWVKVHTIGSTYTPANNVMDIASSDGVTITADAVYTANTRTFEKAAYWMLRYLGHANATAIISAAKSAVEEKAKAAEKDATEVKINGDEWQCEITKIAKGVYKTHMQWKKAAA